MDIEIARSPDAKSTTRLLDSGWETIAAPMEFDIAALWRILLEWRWLILSIAAVGITAAVLITLVTRPLYRATAVVELNPPQVQIVNDEKGNALIPNDANFLGTQYGLLGSLALAERVTQDLNLAHASTAGPGNLAARQEAVAGGLLANLNVAPQPQSNLVKLSFVSPDPAEAARIANGFADGFIRTNLERRYQASSYARSFLEGQIAMVRGQLEKSERQLVQYAQEQGIITTASTGSGAGNAGDTSSLQGSSLITLNNALDNARIARIAAEKKYTESLSGTPSAEASDRTAPLRAQRAALEADYSEKQQTYGPDYPDVARLRSKIDSVNQAITAEIRDVRTSHSGSLRSDYEAALAQEHELETRVEQARNAVLNLRGRSIKYTILQRDVDTNRELYNGLLQRFKEIGVAGGVDTAQATVVDRARVPTAPFRPNLMLNLLIGLGAGLIAGIGAALLLAVLNDSIETPEDVREKLHLAFLGGIPATKGQAPADELDDPASELAEAYLSVTAALQFTTEHGVPPVLLVTSTRQTEGKSTTALALARNFAQLGRTVLLIDADLRKPAFVTGGEKSDGLSSLLTNSDSLVNHVVHTDIENLWVLPCGPIPPSPAQLLASPRISDILREAQSRYSVVIVDSPPILGLADAPLLSAACGMTLLVIEAGKTRTRAALEAQHRLVAAGSVLVGAVLTRYRHHESAYGYGYRAYRYETGESQARKIRLGVLDLSVKNAI